MRYYKAQQIQEKPYLLFHLMAKDEAEYNDRNLDKEDNIFSEDQLPVFDYDICLSQLNGAGKLEPRIQSEIDQAKIDFNTKYLNNARELKFKELIAKDNEISTLTRMGEDTSIAEAEFQDLKNEYNAIK